MAHMLDDQRRDKSLSAHAASKLGLLQFTAALRNNGVDARACHPGLVWAPSVVRRPSPRCLRLLVASGLSRSRRLALSTKHRMLKGFFPAPVRALLHAAASSNPVGRRGDGAPSPASTKKQYMRRTIKTGPKPRRPVLRDGRARRGADARGT